MCRDRLRWLQSRLSPGEGQRESALKGWRAGEVQRDFVVRVTLELVVIYDSALLSYCSVSYLGQRLSDLSHFPAEISGLNEQNSFKTCVYGERELLSERCIL